MYRIDFTDLREAAKIIYCFMTVPSLHNPECTIWRCGFPESITNDKTDFMSEDAFCEKIAKSNADAIACVASTDFSDTRRVVLSLMPDADYLVLNFPSADGTINAEERKLLMLLEKYDG